MDEIIGALRPHFEAAMAQMRQAVAKGWLGRWHALAGPLEAYVSMTSTGTTEEDGTHHVEWTLTAVIPPSHFAPADPGGNVMTKVLRREPTMKDIEDIDFFFTMKGPHSTKWGMLGALESLVKAGVDPASIKDFVDKAVVHQVMTE